MPAHIKWHVVVAVVATTWPYVRHNEDVAPRQVVHAVLPRATPFPSACCLLLTANQFICLCLCRCHMSSYTHTHPLLLPPALPPYRGQKFIIKTLPSLLCAVNCKYDSRVRLGTLCRIARNGLCCPALGRSII